MFVKRRLMDRFGNQAAPSSIYEPRVLHLCAQVRTLEREPRGHQVATSDAFLAAIVPQVLIRRAER